MSRSYKKTPILRYTRYRGKKFARRRFRRITKMRLQNEIEFIPEKSTELTHNYEIGGDSKFYRPEIKNWRRK